MSARFARTLFFFFVARHIVGIMTFAGLIYAASRAPQSPWWLVAVFGLAYLGFTIFQGVKLYRTWRRRVEAERKA